MMYTLRSQYNVGISELPQPLFQSEARCETIDMKMSFHSLVNKTHFHFKGFVLDLALKQRQNPTWKWPIADK